MPKLDKKQLIIQSAIEVFCDNGFEKTTISNVARHAGIGKGTVYGYFKSKEELFSNCVIAMFDYFNDGFMEILSQDIPFREKLNSCFKHTETLLSRASMGISLINKKPTGELIFLADIMKTEADFLKNNLFVATKTAIDNGEIRSDIDIETVTFYIQISVLIIMQSASNDKTNITMIDDILKLIFGGIGNNN